MLASQIHDYYRQQSVLTDPGKNAPLYDELPHTVSELVRVIQGVIILPYGNLLRQGYHIDPNEIDNATFGLRRVEDLLERVQHRYQAPLTVERPPVMRVGMICRNFAVLLVSMLRYQGISARARVGFGAYFRTSYAADHRVAEYWDEACQRWVLIDPMIDEVQRHANKLTFNTLDIGSSDPFWLAGDVWLRCRAGKLNPHDFGDSETDRGMSPIRYALLHDFAYLSKCEVLGCDDWGELIAKPESDLTDTDLALLDQIAELTTRVDTHFEELLNLFDGTAYGRAIREQLSMVR